MTTITSERAIAAPPALVWEVVTDPDVYAAVAPNLSTVEVLRGEGEGMVRRCVDTDGNVWTETVTEWEEGRAYAVAVDVATSDFHRRLFHRFEGRWTVDPRAEDVLVGIRFDVDAKYGPLGRLLVAYFRYRAPALVEAIFDGWEAAIEDRREDVLADHEEQSPIDRGGRRGYPSSEPR